MSLIFIYIISLFQFIIQQIEDAINAILGPSSNFKIEGLDKGRIETFSLTGTKLLKVAEKFADVIVPLAYSNPNSNQSRKSKWQGKHNNRV